MERRSMESRSCGIYVKDRRDTKTVFKEGISEYEIQCKWLEGIESDREWRTEEGHKVRILSPGYHNLYGGPDFKDALIEINGSTFRGDIEIHQKAGDWYQHGHHKDKQYNRVLLHVVLTQEKIFQGAINSEGNIIPTLVLPHSFIEKRYNQAKEKEISNNITQLEIPPCIKQIQFDYEVLVRILSQQRVLRRLEQMRTRFREVSLDELIYEFLFYSLGMGTKYAPLYINLAKQIPYSQAKIWLLEDPRILEAILLHTIGYLQKGVALRNPYALVLEDIRKQYDLNDTSIDILHEEKSYPVFSVYPQANPAIRIACMVGFLSKVEGQLSEFLYFLWKQSVTSDSPWVLWEQFFHTYHYYWSYYNTWEMKRNPTPHGLIGKERVYSILGNILIPFFIFSIQDGFWGEREEKVWNVYYRLPGENNHWLLKRMQAHAEFLFVRRNLLFFEQQALIQWYNTGCSIHPKCIDCPWNMREGINNIALS